MTSKVFSCAIRGLDCHTIEVEADLNQGLPCFYIVGLGDASVQESRERIRSSIKNSGAEFPSNKKIINLAPARLRKEGSHFDLAIAISILIANKQITDIHLKDAMIVGELALNGEIKGIFGSLAITQHAKESGFKKIILPRENAREASFIDGIEVYAFVNLRELISFARGSSDKKAEPPTTLYNKQLPIKSFFPDIIGLEKAKRALSIAAVGFHSVLLSGAPGAGKTLLARAFKSLLPPMSQKETFETTKIYSIAGLTQQSSPIISTRPFREVHHTASAISIIGGGNIPRPGEISLAHNGVLFLDEIMEFPKKVLETLRQPLEDKYINLTRSKYTSKYPANFILLATSNPCPCGFSGEPKKRCICRPHEIQNYKKKLSGPIRDRIDIFLDIPSIPIKDFEQINEDKYLEDSLRSSWEFQAKRQADQQILSTNANMDLSCIKCCCHLSPEAKKLLELSSVKFLLSKRSYLKVLKIARSIADLESSELINSEHIAEALQYRQNG